MVALSLGGIAGNLWSEFTWAPQINLFNAVLIIILLPTEIWLGIKDLSGYIWFFKITFDLSYSESIRKRRSELYFKMFFIGFSMGKICSYNLMTTAPRMLCPMMLAYLVSDWWLVYSHCFFQIDKIDHRRSPRTHRMGTRLELFFKIAICTIVICWMLLLLLDHQLNFNSVFFSFLASGVNLHLLFAHFQVIL